MSDDIKGQLVASQAGMRFIAMMTIYNNGGLERLHAYMNENGLEASEEWLDLFREMHARYGRLRVHTLEDIGEHHMVALMLSEQGAALSRHDLRVQKDYPHKITLYEVEEA